MAESSSRLFRVNIARASAIVVALWWSAACAVHPPASAAPTAIPATGGWPKAYLDAIQDALDPQPREVVNNLVAIVATNPLLKWRNFGDGPRVLMATLGGYTSSMPAAPGSPYNTGSREIWVTAVPQLRDVCTKPGFSGSDLAMRLRQILGLTPNFPVIALVEIWVLPSQLFRPAADNSITGDSAGLTMPSATESWYRLWFNELRATQYYQSSKPSHDAYPWTQLGYTYDWGSENHQGLSEFVIRQQSAVYINGVTPYQRYCAGG